MNNPLMQPLQSSLSSNILIVDDSPDNLRLLSSVLTRHGYQIRNAINGPLALRAVQAAPPDLILLDINMPQMNGYEVCQSLKRDTKSRHIPIIFISVLSEALDKVKAFKVGGADYITKPFQIEEVLARVRHQLALQQLHLQLLKTNENLEQQIQVRTAELQLAFSNEATLKRITDNVRDSLDESQILQTAVRELTVALGADSCNAALLDANKPTSTVHYEFTQAGVPHFQGMVVDIDSFEGRPQLLQRQHFQFCPLQPFSREGRFAILACPILDHHKVFGELWLYHAQPSHVYSEQDIRLVQQVANQCAIALRQARLYQTAQSQVKELERLNRLKDDFLSTISHELRTPMANIRMAAQMLEIILEPLGVLEDATSLAGRYFQILKEACQQEINLINDLLDLSHLDAETEPLVPSCLKLQDWVPYIVEVVAERMQAQQPSLKQSLKIEIPPDLSPLMTDFSYLERILTELLNNAYKHTPPEATIVVSARAVPTGVQISVSNSGVEIPDSELPYVFDKFYRIPNSDPWKQEGIGLGLALVKKRVEQLQGAIAVTSENGWTTFTLQLPWVPLLAQLGEV